MSKKRISDKAGWVNSRELPRGPNGRALCRLCRREVPKRRKTFCSKACVHYHKLRTQPGYVRTCLAKRDHGVCAVCGLDVHAAFDQLQATRRSGTHAEWVEAFKKKLGLPPGSRKYKRYWDADHIKPVAEDGGECGLDNYQTLCLLCHKAKTAEQQKRRTAVKQPEHQQENEMSDTPTPTSKQLQKGLKAWMTDEDNKPSRLISAAKLKEMTKAMDPDIRMHAELHSALCRELGKMLKQAMIRCYDNKRVTVRPSDL